MDDVETSTSAFGDILERLSAWAEERKLVVLAMLHFDMWFENERGSIHGWTRADVYPVFRSHSLFFANALLSYPYITTALDTYCLKGWQVGNYRLITRLNGELDDDYFVLDWSKSEYDEKNFGICPTARR